MTWDRVLHSAEPQFPALWNSHEETKRSKLKGITELSAHHTVCAPLQKLPTAHSFLSHHCHSTCARAHAHTQCLVVPLRLASMIHRKSTPPPQLQTLVSSLIASPRHPDSQFRHCLPFWAWVRGLATLFPCLDNAPHQGTAFDTNEKWSSHKSLL